uniref:NADH-ubiquinone oxidoreductase chain 4 n=1 Tax=Craugastor augusti TaxID=228429 RepID=S4V1P4_9NEOB|nr:NADH dehydrogenase subunit 4 [Craugastor augusti]
MLTILTPLIFLLAATWLTPAKRLWETSATISLIIASLSTLYLNIQTPALLINPYLMIDEISSPLIILTYWLTAPTIIASQSKISKEPISRQRAYISTIILLQITTLLAFLANNILLFFVLFEATIIPTLIIITRWGAQEERMLAGTYLLFYTLMGSLPLLAALLYFHKTFGTLSVTVTKMTAMAPQFSALMMMWCISCLIAFLIKLPLYGFHLWLPKAHVEAPIAGSMILAGTLLKLGGYGILRAHTMIDDSLFFMASPLIAFSMVGVLTSAILCSRQTDLKSLIAFSSVSHMGLVIAASLIKTEWSISGSLVLMISHGLVSSAMFCLANTSYERTNTRTMLLLQGSQIVLPLMAAWWLMTALMNLALPPSPNFIGELFILTSLFQWSNLTLLVSALSIIFTTTYSLYLFWSTQREFFPADSNSIFPTQTREHLLILIHLAPVLGLMLSPSLLF